MIEDSADTIVLLHADEADGPNAAVEGRIAKNRNGPACGWEPDLGLRRIGSQFRFETLH